jgi:signal transduction histidine kinase
LLTLASSENGVEQWEGVDLGKITADAVAGRRDEAVRRDVLVHASIADARTSGDPRLVESLVTNLIDNAIRHNVAGGSVEVATVESGDGAWVEVRNTGAVIPAGEVDRLFVPFQRLRAERTGQHDGHGLGLAIVKAIATAHGAVVTAHAPASGGLEVRVLFPVER